MRIIALLILIAVLFAGWFYYNNGRLPESVDDVKAGLPTATIEEKTTTVTVPTGVDVETERKQVDYPSIDVEQRGNPND